MTADERQDLNKRCLIPYRKRIEASTSCDQVDLTVQVVITIRCDNIRPSPRIIEQLRHLALAGTLIERGKKCQS
ncbi:hypothetical protein MKX03_011682 [Papaver bracteatum]|nr:hypothetical protein MKX03_011682 [Papaver bracteatum]